MKVVVAVSLFAILAACSKSPQQPVTQLPSASSSATEASAPLTKLFADVELCAAQCKTLYLAPGLNRTFDYTLELPDRFKTVLDNATLRNRFETMVRQLPVEYQKVGLRLPEDPPEKELWGGLAIVVENGNRKVYVYSLAGFQRPDSSFLEVAIDANSKEMSALLRPTPNHDEYYLIGAAGPQVELLTTVVAQDLGRAKEQLRIAQAPSEAYDFTANPVVLPFDAARVAEMTPRLRHLSSRYAAGRISQVRPPSAVVEADALKEASAWYAADLNFSSCISSMSPAERIAIIQDAGVRAETKDRSDSSGNLLEVEVAYSEGSHERFYRYFKRKTDCEDSLPRAEAIPDKYR